MPATHWQFETTCPLNTYSSYKGRWFSSHSKVVSSLSIKWKPYYLTLLLKQLLPYEHSWSNRSLDFFLPKLNITFWNSCGKFHHGYFQCLASNCKPSGVKV